MTIYIEYANGQKRTLFRAGNNMFSVMDAIIRDYFKQPENCDEINIYHRTALTEVKYLKAIWDSHYKSWFISAIKNVK